MNESTDESINVNRLIKVAVTAARARASKYGQQWSLTDGQLAELGARCEGRCEATGRPFITMRGLKTRVQPWHPSLDRIDNSKGYSYGNTRIVCTIFNLAKSDFPEEIFNELIAWSKSTKLNPSITSRAKSIEDLQWRTVTEDRVNDALRRITSLEILINQQQKTIASLEDAIEKVPKTKPAAEPQKMPKPALDKPLISIVRRGEVVNATGLSASTIRRLEAEGQFPQRVQLAPRSVGWRSSEIRDWLSARQITP